MSLLEVKGLTKRFGGIVAVNNISFQINNNEIVGLIGPNGAGKSTLVQLLMRLLKPDAGQIYFQGQEITRIKSWEVVERGIAGTFQCTRPFRRLPVIANVMVPCSVGRGLKNRGQVKSEVKTLSVLKSVGIAHLALQPALKLSHGDLKRLEIARALASAPELMILDEPFAGLNPNEMQQLSVLLRDLGKGGTSESSQEGLSMIIIEHKLSELMKIVDRVIVLNFGDILADGTPEKITNDKKVIDAYIGEEVIYAAGN